MTEILLKVTLNTINLTNLQYSTEKVYLFKITLTGEYKYTVSPRYTLDYGQLQWSLVLNFTI
jgi:hypothetical protein